MGLNNQLAERQSNPAAANLCSLTKIKNLGAAVQWNTRTGVGKIKRQVIAILGSDNMNGSPVGLRFDGIAQQVVESLPQPRFITLNSPRTRREIFRKSDLFLRALRCDRFETRGENFTNIEIVSFESDWRRVIAKVAH